MFCNLNNHLINNFFFDLNSLKNKKLIMKKLKNKSNVLYVSRLSINNYFLEFLTNNYKISYVKYIFKQKFLFNQFFFYKKKIDFILINFLNKKEITIFFKLKSNNVVCSVNSNGFVIFWNSIKKCMNSGLIITINYSKENILFLCESILIFFKKANYIKSNLVLTLTLSGLTKYRWYIIQFYLKIEKIAFFKIIDLSFLAHNGIRQKKKRRLAKKKRRKVFWLGQEQLKVSLTKKKKLNSFCLSFKATDLFYIYDFFFKFLKLYFFSIKSLVFFNFKNSSFDILRSVHAFSNQKQKFILQSYCLLFNFLFLKSSFTRKFLLTWFSCLNFNLFSGNYKLINNYTSFKF